MDRAQASLRFLASLLGPADEPVALAEADAAWRFRPDGLPAGALTFVWGRRTASAADGTNTPSPLRALRRELALGSIGRRVPAGYQATRVLRLPPPSARTGSLRARARSALLAGAVVQIRRAGAGATVLDEIARAVGARGELGRLVLGAGVGARARAELADGSRALLRLGPAGSPWDPRPSVDVLEALEGSTLVARALGTGVVGDAAWSAESVLPGSAPRRLDARLARDVASFAASLPRIGGPPAAPREDLAAIVAAFPDRRDRLEALADATDSGLALLPVVLRHGDLWAGNLLIEGGQLTGVIDWDAWHPSGAPGADLMNLFVAELSARAGRPRGWIWRDHPWRDPSLLTVAAGYWPAFDVEPDEGQLRAVAIAGWAAHVASALRHAPELTTRRRWVEGNVVPMLATD